MVVTLSYHNKFVGVLGITRSKSQGEFDEKDRISFGCWLQLFPIYYI